MSESPPAIMKTGIIQGYSGLRPGPNPYSLGTRSRELWDVGWHIGDSLRRQHEIELEAAIMNITSRFEKAMR